jgi:hypothetical protein
VLDSIERTAWRVPLPTRRLFQTLALVAAGALVVSGLVAGWVAARNASTLADAREQGLGLATAVTDFRTNLAEADALAAETLISGGLEDPATRALYDRHVLAASVALTDAGLVATDDDRDAIRAMGDGLVRYAGLVEASRANSRQGYPVGAAYLAQARTIANDELVPLAEQQRRVGEQRIARSANSVGGPVAALAVLVLAVALVVLVGCMVVVAGRTRRIAHPALLGAAVVAIGALALVTSNISAQSRELRRAATGDIEAYVAANAASSRLADLRVTEISAVAARGSGAPLYDQFRSDADELLAALADAPGDPGGIAQLYERVEAYVDAVSGDDGVAATDLGGDNQGAARLALSSEDGGSAGLYDRAATGQDPAGDGTAGGATGEGGDVEPGTPDGSAVGADGGAFDFGSAAGLVALEGDDLEARFDAAGAADTRPLGPIVLGVIAAALAGGGVLARGRRYR